MSGLDTSIVSQDGHNDLSLWFGLSYATFLTLPRVLMEAMSDEWQGKMAALLNEYDEAFPNQPDIGTRVQATRDGKMIKWPQVFLSYRHPLYAEIDKMKAQP